MSVTFETELELAVEENLAVTAQAKSRGAAKKKADENEEDLDDDAPAKKSAAKKSADEEDMDDDDDSDVEDDDDWDPDFDEFDVPKSKGGKGSKDADEEEDFKPEAEEDLKELDLFNDSGFDDEDEDDL
jgi:DNA-directed RNA polymerase subunit delta